MDEHSTCEAAAYQEGSVIDERYRVRSLLGTGGMGCVYLVDDLNRENRSVALKLLHPELTANAAVVQRFLREMQLMRRVDHPNVVKTYELCVKEDLVYFTMEYVKGTTLDQLLANGSFKRKAIPGCVLQIAQALDAIHRAGIVHRDLKPGNIIVLEDRSIKVTDFGIARPKSSDMTMHNEILGSVCYIAPEIWLGEEPRPSCDLYSLGIILYELTTGDVPFDGGSAHQLMRLHLERTPIPPIERDPHLAPWLNELALKLLEKSPANRFCDAAEVVAFISSHLAGNGAARSANGEYCELFELLENSAEHVVQRKTASVENGLEPAVLTGGVQGAARKPRKQMRSKAALIGGHVIASLVWIWLVTGFWWDQTGPFLTAGGPRPARGQLMVAQQIALLQPTVTLPHGSALADSPPRIAVAGEPLLLLCYGGYVLLLLSLVAAAKQPQPSRAAALRWIIVCAVTTLFVYADLAPAAPPVAGAVLIWTLLGLLLSERRANRYSSPSKSRA